MFFQNIYQSDWHMLQLDTVMREMFRDIDGVIFLDVWQMTSCHYLHENIHPGPVIIANEIDMFLSYVCPAWGLFKLIWFHKGKGKLPGRRKTNQAVIRPEFLKHWPNMGAWLSGMLQYYLTLLTTINFGLIFQLT